MENKYFVSVNYEPKPHIKLIESDDYQLKLGRYLFNGYIYNQGSVFNSREDALKVVNILPLYPLKESISMTLIHTYDGLSFEVPTYWAKHWILENCDMTIDDFLSEYTWDDSKRLYDQAINEKIILVGNYKVTMFN